MITKTKFDIDNYLIKQKSTIDNHLKKIFEENNNYTEPKQLWDALRYSLLNEGKRIRGILCLITHESFGNPYKDDCLTVSSVVEMIHAMSLIHDDLPSMDNDDLRRGKPSCHKAFGEATAILTGDAMLALAFQLIIENTNHISEAQKLEIINILAKAFSFGLVPGQILDLSHCNKKADLKILENIARLKTAELIKTSIICGAITALGKTTQLLNQEFKSITKEKIIKVLTNFGLKIGIAFQIIDDILDLTSDTKTLGKTSRKDEKQNKLTYPSILGIKGSKKMANELIIQAKSELEILPIKTSLLFSLADYIINRIN